MLGAEDAEDLLQQLAEQANRKEQCDAGEDGEDAPRGRRHSGGDGHRDGLGRHHPGCARATQERQRERQPLLEGDLVNDAETNERGERKRNADGEQIHVDGQPVGGGWMRWAIVVGGCHVDSLVTSVRWSVFALVYMWASKEKAHISRFALIRGLLNF